MIDPELKRLERLVFWVPFTIFVVVLTILFFAGLEATK